MVICKKIAEKKYFFIMTNHEFTLKSRTKNNGSTYRNM